MLNGTNVLDFLYYTVHIRPIVTVINLIFAIIIGFFSYRLSRSFAAKVIGGFHGIVLGGMLGCIITESWFSICLGIIIGVIIFYMIEKFFINGYIFIISFTFFMQLTYILVNIIINFIGVEFYDIFGKERIIKEDYLAKDFAIIVALITGLIFGIIMAKKIYGYKINIFFCAFLGAIQFAGIAQTLIGEAFFASYKWEFFFIPMMNIEFNDHALEFLFVIIILAIFMYRYQSENMEKKKIQPFRSSKIKKKVK